MRLEPGAREGDEHRQGGRGPGPGSRPVRDGVVEQRPEQQGRDHADDRRGDDADEEADERTLVGAGHPEHAAQQVALEVLALHGVRIAPEAHHRLMHHQAGQRTGSPSMFLLVRTLGPTLGLAGSLRSAPRCAPPAPSSTLDHDCDDRPGSPGRAARHGAALGGARGAPGGERPRARRRVPRPTSSSR